MKNIADTCNLHINWGNREIFLLLFEKDGTTILDGDNQNFQANDQMDFGMG